MQSMISVGSGFLGSPKNLHYTATPIEYKAHTEITFREPQTNKDPVQQANNSRVNV